MIYVRLVMLFCQIARNRMRPLSCLLVFSLSYILYRVYNGSPASDLGALQSNTASILGYESAWSLSFGFYCRSTLP